MPKRVALFEDYYILAAKSFNRKMASGNNNAMCSLYSVRQKFPTV